MFGVPRSCCRSAYPNTSGLNWASTFTIRLPCPLHAQHKVFESLNAPIIHTRNWSDDWKPQEGFPSDVHIMKIMKRHHRFYTSIGKTRESIEKHKHKKWGFLIYRCDYSSEEAWNKFLSNVRYELERHLKIFEAEDLRDTLEMTIKGDKKSLEGAPIDQIRDLFNTWVQSGETNAENSDTPYAALFQSPRYRYCVHADADAIDSVVSRAPQPPKHDWDEIGYVNLVQLVHEDYIEGVSGGRSDYDGYEDDGEYFTKMNDVKVPISYLGLESYNSLDEDATWERYVRYRRDDGVSCGE